MRILPSALVVTVLLAGCASAPIAYSRRVIDTPVGTIDRLGAPKDPGYRADVQVEHDVAHIRVFVRAECPIIRVQLVSRVEETLQGNRVVESVHKGTHEVVDTAASGGTAPCESGDRYASIPLSLEYSGNYYPIGHTSDKGELDVDLTAILRDAPPGDRPASARLVYRDVTIHELSVSHLTARR